MGPKEKFERMSLKGKGLKPQISIPRIGKFKDPDPGAPTPV